MKQVIILILLFGFYAVPELRADSGQMEIGQRLNAAESNLVPVCWDDSEARYLYTMEAKDVAIFEYTPFMKEFEAAYNLRNAGTKADYERKRISPYPHHYDPAIVKKWTAEVYEITLCELYEFEGKGVHWNDNGTDRSRGFACLRGECGKKHRDKSKDWDRPFANFAKLANDYLKRIRFMHNDQFREFAHSYFTSRAEALKVVQRIIRTKEDGDPGTLTKRAYYDYIHEQGGVDNLIFKTLDARLARPRVRRYQAVINRSLQIHERNGEYITSKRPYLR